MSTQSLLIVGGRVLDPAQGVDKIANVHIEDGRVRDIGDVEPQHTRRIDAGNMIVCPGLIDVHVHLREPGQEHKETIATGTAAAVAGGFSGVACMPNTRPPIDSPAVVHSVLERADKSGSCRVHPIACLTRDRAGERLVDFARLKAAGAAAFSDDGSGVADDDLMASAFAQLRELGMIAIQHCEDPKYPPGVIHKGQVSRDLGLPGMDAASEESMIARDLRLSTAAGAHYHVAHVSTGKAVAMVRQAKATGSLVTTEVCPQHLLLTDEACRSRDANFKVHPPLRDSSDAEACIAGVIDGTIDMLVTDHAPHTPEEKAKGMNDAPPGMIGLETSLALFAKALVEPGHIDWPRLVEMMSSAPARVFGLPGGTIRVGQPADVTIFDPQREWTIDVQQFRSRSRNCPFHGMSVRSKVACTIVNGRVQYHDPNLCE